MQYYAKSDETVYVGTQADTGKQAIIRGWDNIYHNYKKAHPTQQNMGKLKLIPLINQPLSKNLMLIIAQYKNKVKGKTIIGYTSLIWKKINNKWLIISDHSA